MSTEFDRLVARHQIDEWRDDQTLAAARTLDKIVLTLIAANDIELAKATNRDIFVAPGEFIATRIAPSIRNAAEPVVGAMMERANTALRRIAQHQAVWRDRQSQNEPAASPFEGWHDVAAAGAPLVGGAAVAASIPFVAVTTTTAWFGLVTATAISWPIVAFGGAVAVTAIATGLFNTARIKARFTARLRGKARSHVVATLITGTAAAPSLLEQVTTLFADTAEQAKGS